MKKVTSGALWEKATSKGDLYFSGQVEIDGEKYLVSFFKNSYKKEDKHPDWKTIAEKTEKKSPDTTFNADKGRFDDTPF